MKTLFVNTAKKTKEVKTVTGSLELGAFCDYGVIYKIVPVSKGVVVFCHD